MITDTLKYSRGKKIAGMIAGGDMTIKDAASQLHVNYHNARRCLGIFRHNRPIAWCGPISTTDKLAESTQTKPEYPPEEEEPIRPTAPEVLLRAAIFDIETTGFRASGYAGRLVLASILPLGSSDVDTVVIPFEHGADDRFMLIDLLGRLWKYDILIHQNGADFDLNFLNTRRMWHGMPPLRTWMYFDTYQCAKTIAPKIGKSLESMGYFFRSDSVKTKIGQLLNSLPSPYRATYDRVIAEIRYHCEEDVKITRDVFNNLFIDAMTIGGANQFKLTKWRRGIPSMRAWLSEYDLAIEDSKNGKGNGRH